MHNRAYRSFLRSVADLAAKNTALTHFLQSYSSARVFLGHPRGLTSAWRGFNRPNQSVSFGYGHTWRRIPDPIRTRKSSRHGRRQYCGGGPRGNTACRNLFFVRFSDRQATKRTHAYECPATFFAFENARIKSKNRLSKILAGCSAQKCIFSGILALEFLWHT